MLLVWDCLKLRGVHSRLGEVFGGRERKKEREREGLCSSVMEALMEVREGFFGER